MAESKTFSGEHLKPISELSNYTIEKGDPDPRGYVVLAADGGEIGVVDDLIVNTQAMKVEYLVVTPNSRSIARDDKAGSVLVGASDADVRSDSRQVIARRFAAAELVGYTRPAAAIAGAERDQTRLTRSEEELHVDKREVSRGEARIGKHVETERVSQPVTRRREELVVERRPVEAGARAHADISDEEIRVPLTEEEVVIEKRPVVKEELVVGKRIVEERDTVHADVRREEFHVEQNPDMPADTRNKRRDR